MLGPMVDTGSLQPGDARVATINNLSLTPLFGTTAALGTLTCGKLNCGDIGATDRQVAGTIGSGTTSVKQEEFPAVICRGLGDSHTLMKIYQ
tara:strand:- start:168 stop:443 length:276 start_codon:yes stop_codon:yes gene_type:complete